MNDLQQFIQTTRDSRELKRALVIQNTLAGRSWPDVAAELGVKDSFIGTWRWRYKRDGIACLSLGYQGAKGYLTATEKAAVITWIQEQKRRDLKALSQHITASYGVTYKSSQSDYALLKAARISWKKSQDRQPKADPKKISMKQEEMKKKR